jgi:uncharacterized protein YggE
MRKGVKMKTKFALTTTVFVFALLMSACSTTTTMAPAAQPPIRSMTVSGTGQVTLKPDIAYINIGVHTEKPTASEATAQNSTDSQAVINALKAAGVAVDDIQTTNFSIYLREQQINPADGTTPIPAMYAVDNTVYITVRDLTKVGTILDAAVKAGANNANNIQFDLADKTKALSDARAAAVKVARAEADQLAAASGVTLGNIQTISYNENTPGPVFYGKSVNMSVADASVPISAGTLQISVNVTLTYEIK